MSDRLVSQQHSSYIMLLFLFTYAVFLIMSCSSHAITQKSKRIVEWNESRFTISTSPTIENKALWDITQEGNLDLPVITTLPDDKADSVLEVFNKQSQEKRTHGIFIYSKSYAIPDTPQERQYMTNFLWELYNDKQWRESESKLINDLRVLCQSKGIALYVNLSANLQGEWKELVAANREMTQ